MYLQAVLSTSTGSTGTFSNRTAQSSNRRRKERRSLTLSAFANSPNESGIPVLIRDISPGARSQPRAGIGPRCVTLGGDRGDARACSLKKSAGHAGTGIPVSRGSCTLSAQLHPLPSGPQRHRTRPHPRAVLHTAARRQRSSSAFKRIRCRQLRLTLYVGIGACGQLTCAAAKPSQSALEVFYVPHRVNRIYCFVC